jgi:hypothetical protein
MNQALAKLCDDLAALLGDEHAADDYRAVLDGIARDATNSRDAAKLLKAFEWIAEQPRSTSEKLEAMGKLTAMPRCHVLIPSAQEFFGWKS